MYLPHEGIYKEYLFSAVFFFCCCCCCWMEDTPPSEFETYLKWDIYTIAEMLRSWISNGIGQFGANGVFHMNYSWRHIVVCHGYINGVFPNSIETCMKGSHCCRPLRGHADGIRPADLEHSPSLSLAGQVHGYWIRLQRRPPRRSDQ